MRFIVIPDTQKYVLKSKNALDQVRRAIHELRRERPCELVIGLGDLVNDGASDMSQVEQGARFVKGLEADGCLYVAVPGNRDYDQVLVKQKKATKVGLQSRSLACFNRYLVSASSYLYFDNVQFFQPGCLENVFFEYQTYKFLLLEFAPRQAVVAWVQSVLDQDQDQQPLIFITHNFLDYKGDYANATSHGSSHNYILTHQDADGQQLWQQLLQPLDRRILSFSGHFTRGTMAERFDQTQGGQRAAHIFRNWQTAVDGGGGRFLVVDVAGDLAQASVRSYQPGRGYLDSGQLDIDFVGHRVIL